MFDRRTGFEIEMVVGPSHTRLDLLDGLGEVERFEQLSKVPMPPIGEETAGVIEDIARHHAARVAKIAPDLSHFYLLHRAARTARVSVVHDNTLAGGERVAEIVTAPLRRDDLDLLHRIAERAVACGATIPDEAALHIHVDGAELKDPRALARLIRAYDHHEEALSAFVDRPASLQRAGASPDGIAALLENIAARDGTWDEARPWLVSAYPTRSFGLNLYNLAHEVADKLTVEFKIAKSTLDVDRILAIRELYLSLVEWALGDEPLEALAPPPSR